MELQIQQVTPSHCHFTHCYYESLVTKDDFRGSLNLDSAEFESKGLTSSPGFIFFTKKCKNVMSLLRLSE